MLLSAAIALPSTEALSFGSSKLFQILVPLMVYVVLQETPGLKAAFPRLLKAIAPQADPNRWEYIFKMLVGFIAWKIGCDLGFLLVTTNSAPWGIAFTLAGLIPYALGMYVVYYLIGTKMLIQGQLNPFKEEYRSPNSVGRPSRLKQFVSKFFHENMNSTSANAPLRQVSIKPLVDYGAILITWPLYNVFLLFSQSGEINFSPLFRFDFLSIFVFYVVNVFGFILGFNLGEFLYFRAHYAIEILKKIGRRAQLLRRTRKLWDAFDIDKDGRISKAELRYAMRALGWDLSEGEVNTYFEQFDTDASGDISFSEFQNAFIVAPRRRSRLVLEAGKQIGWVERAIGAIAIRWGALKNNTHYIRLQGFLRRYGLNNRWLLSSSLGIAFIVLLEPSIAGSIFDRASQWQHQQFYRHGTLDETHLAQMVGTMRDLEPPLPTLLVARGGSEAIAGAPIALLERTDPDLGERSSDFPPTPIPND